MRFHYLPPEQQSHPILISIPHCGTEIPGHLGIKKKICPDTDWFLEHLYDFAPKMGIGIIHAQFARYVVDLNRNPSSVPLYNDGRILTDAIPTTQFDGTALYDIPPTKDQKQERIKQYFTPYHDALAQKLEELRTQFGWALLFDAHSIKRHVPTIQKTPFPDLILGSNDRTSASSKLIETTWNILKNSKYSCTHNTPFKGGYITRSFGDPQNNIHALQLEMSQDLYMDEEKHSWDESKARPMKTFLTALFETLLEAKP